MHVTSEQLVRLYGATISGNFVMTHLYTVNPTSMQGAVKNVRM